MRVVRFVWVYVINMSIPRSLLLKRDPIMRKYLKRTGVSYEKKNKFIINMFIYNRSTLHGNRRKKKKNVERKTKQNKNSWGRFTPSTNCGLWVNDEMKWNCKPRIVTCSGGGLWIFYAPQRSKRIRQIYTFITHLRVTLFIEKVISVLCFG